ncbi:MAG: DUF1573 domain-containing protein [bacterium]|nr:DUF1573 domain-containing protein [bacterium]
MKEKIVSVVMALLVLGVIIGLGVKFTRKAESPPVSSTEEAARSETQPSETKTEDRADTSITSDTQAEAASEIDTGSAAHSEPTRSLIQPENQPARVKPEEVKPEPYLSQPEKKEREPEKKKAKVKPAPVKPEAQPDIHFEELTHDFGEIGQGIQVTHVFKFKNVGNTDLNIKNTKASCGCTAALLSTKVIAPGDTGEVKVTFSSGNFSGRQSKNIYVDSDDPDEGKVTLEITATVKPPVTLNPDRLVFGKVKIGEEVSKEVEIRAEQGIELKIQKVEVEVDYIQTEILERNPKGGKIKVTLRANTPVGAVEKDIKIFTNHPQKPVTELHVSARVQGRIQLSPEYLYLGQIYRGEPITREAIINKIDESGPPLEVSAESNLDFLQVKLTTMEEGKRYKLSFSLAPDFPSGRIKAEVEIKTNDPDQPVINLPVVGEVQEKE